MDYKKPLVPGRLSRERNFQWAFCMISSSEKDGVFVHGIAVPLSDQ
jgi:hypothetical protein